MSSSLFSQEDYIKLQQSKTQNPTYIFNKNIIGNEYVIKSLGTSEAEVKEKVDEISVLKDKGNRESNEYFNWNGQTDSNLYRRLPFGKQKISNSLNWNF